MSASSKPQLEIHNAVFYPDLNVLTGVCYSHPRLGTYEGGKQILTSSIVNRNKDVFETLNSIYTVKSWVVEPEKQLEAES